MITIPEQARPPHVAAWRPPGQPDPCPSYVIWSERYPHQPWHVYRLLAPQPGAVLPHHQNLLGKMARIEEYLQWLARHDPGFGFEIKGLPPCLRRSQMYRVVGCDRIVVRHANGRVNQFVHPWGELLVEPLPGYQLRTSRPFALPLVFLDALDHDVSSGRVMAEIPHEQKAPEPIDALSELFGAAS